MYWWNKNGKYMFSFDMYNEDGTVVGLTTTD